MTGYASGLRDKRITIYNREAQTVGDYGVDGDGVSWRRAGAVWAAVTWAKGMRAMNEGAVDVYGVVMVRMNYSRRVDCRSRIVYGGDVYQILPETYHEDYRANTIQFNAQVIVGESIPEPAELPRMYLFANGGIYATADGRLLDFGGR